MKRIPVVTAAAAVISLVTLSLRSQQGSVPVKERVTVLVSFGLTAKSTEDWSGAAKLTNAKLVKIAGRHFSANDATNADGSWTCTTRRDEVAPYADLHYTEMRPGSVPEVRHQPVGVLLTIEPEAGARVAINTHRAQFESGLNELAAEPRMFANGAASIRLVPTPELLSTEAYEDDEPSITAMPDGSIAVAWVAYQKEAERVFVRVRRPDGVWNAAEEVSPKPADIFRTSLAATEDGTLWVVWAERDGDKWKLWMRKKPRGGAWKERLQLSGVESATFHRAATDGKRLYVTWQGYVGGQSDIYYGASDGELWSGQTRVSTSSANDWEPAIAVSPQNLVYIAWDSYDRGNYDIFFRLMGTGMPPQAVTNSGRFQAHASIAVDSRNRPWVAWNESGLNWGKDQGFLIPTPLATPLHQQRWTKVAVFSGYGWDETSTPPPHMNYNAEHPQVAIAGSGAGSGAVTMMFRHYTRRASRSIGSVLAWENYVTNWDGARWSDPQPVPESAGWIEKHAQLARDKDGQIWAAWMTDNRPFSTMVPGNAEVVATRLSPAPKMGTPSLTRYTEAFEEEIPVHTAERADVEAIRNYTIASGGKQYKIYRGDMHRHTDLSQDFKYDGSLFEVYRYALDAAGFDYIAPTDHQAGYDQEFSWWQGQKYVDLFLQPERFVPLFAYERSLRYPNGHRNIVWSQRGVRTLPIPAEEASGKVGAKKLFEHLRATNGISMPHSSATAQGTDWRDNDPVVEPLMEIFQGYRNSYEYEGAPRAATALNQHAQKSGWQPAGFWWNALEKGYKLGVQASSDHWSTHISYACLLVDTPTREGLLDAIRRRHSYAATDNIILDVRARAGGKEYLQGDVFAAAGPAAIVVKARGTGTIKQIDVIGNKRFLYTTRPNAREAGFEFTDENPRKGESWYYVRVLQEDGQLAWSSPVWITR